MRTLVLTYHVHQPYRLAPCTSFEPSRPRIYFDEHANARIAQRIAERCYVPATRALTATLRQLGGAARVAFSITGTALEQLAAYAPQAVDALRDLIGTGSVECLGETYHHTLASLYDDAEFRYQVERHTDAVVALGAPRPSVFRNTELVYDDHLAELVADLGFRGVVAEGVDDVLAGRSRHIPYASPSGVPLLLRDYERSDDIAFRFGSGGDGSPVLSPRRFLDRLEAVMPRDGVALVYIDYETFGEHHGSASGIIDFLAELPRVAVASGGWRCATPGDVLTVNSPLGTVSFPRGTSWADTPRDLSAWCGNNMQRRALQSAYDLGPALRRRGDAAILETWRRLLSSDHFYYMATPRSTGDGAVHAGFSPYESPYEAFINYMNVLRHFRAVHVEGESGL